MASIHQVSEMLQDAEFSMLGMKSLWLTLSSCYGGCCCQVVRRVKIITSGPGTSARAVQLQLQASEGLLPSRIALVRFALGDGSFTFTGGQELVLSASLRPVHLALGLHGCLAPTDDLDS
jgi:hypothetical protein